MDNPIFILEAPILDDESVMKVNEFLQNLMHAFEAHYYVQLSRYSRTVHQPDCYDRQSKDTPGDQQLFDDEILF